MLRIRLSPERALGDDLAAAVNALLADGVVAFPTETFYGLAVNPRSSSAVRKVFAPVRKPVVKVHISRI